MALGRVFTSPLLQRNDTSGPGLFVIGGTFTFTATDLTLVSSDPRELRLFVAPKGFRVINLTGYITDVDSGTALQWNLGDAGDVDRLIAASTKGRSAANLDLSDLVTTTGRGYRYPADTWIDFQVTAATTAGGSGGTCQIYLHGFMD